jgi:hypothetical protein
MGRALTTIGAAVAGIGTSLALLPRPIENPLGLVALAYTSRALYDSFFVFRSGFDLILFLPTPALLIALLPHADRLLRRLWFDPLVALAGRDGLAGATVALVPLALAGPFYARLAGRMARRGHEGHFTLLHAGAVSMALIALGLTFPVEWAGLAAGGLTLAAWGVLAVLLDLRYMSGVAGLGAVAIVVHTVRILALPVWAWLVTLCVVALGLLAVHLRRPAAPATDDPLHGLGDLMEPISLVLAIVALAGYSFALLSGHVTGSGALGLGSLGFDAALGLLLVYFALSTYGTYRTACAVVPVVLVLVEAFVVSIRFGLVDASTAGMAVAIASSVPMVAGLAVRSSLVVLGPPALAGARERDLLASVLAGLSQMIGLAAFALPPVLSWSGSFKYLVIALIQLPVVTRSLPGATLAVLSLVMVIHAPAGGYTREPAAWLIVQAIDLTLGLGALMLRQRLAASGSRDPAADALVTAAHAFSGLSMLAFILAPALTVGHTSTVTTILACLMQFAQGVGYLALAPAFASESLVYAGELALGLVHLRLLGEGLLPRTLVMGYALLAGSFFLYLTHGSLFALESRRVYRGPARLTSLVLPALVLIRALGSGGADGATLVFLIGLFYHLAAIRGEGTPCLYFAILFYNCASAMFPYAPEQLRGRYLVPLGLSLLVLSHSPGHGLGPDQLRTCRFVGLLMIYWEPLPRALLGSHEPGAMVLLIALALMVGMVGLAMRVTLYLAAGSGLLVIAVVTFVIQQIPRDTQLGTIFMLGLGLFLILMGAVFEKTRATLRTIMESLQSRFADWE